MVTERPVIVTGFYIIILHDLFPNIDIHQYNYIVLNNNYNNNLKHNRIWQQTQLQ